MASCEVLESAKCSLNIDEKDVPVHDQEESFSLH